MQIRALNPSMIEQRIEEFIASRSRGSVTGSSMPAVEHFDIHQFHAACHGGIFPLLRIVLSLVRASGPKPLLRTSKTWRASPWGQSVGSNCCGARGDQRGDSAPVAQHGRW